MDWFIALNEAADKEFIGHTKQYEDFAKVAVFSARINAPSLRPHLIYNGARNSFTEDMERLGVRVIHHKLSFEHLLDTVPGRDPGWRHIARGAMLRMDLPEIVETDETILYTDTDVLFLADPGRYSFPCEVFSAGPEFDINNFSDINTGAMIINPSNARASFRGLNEWTQQHLHIVPDFDQGAIKMYYQGNWGRLDPRMNWKPYWGRNPEALLIHYHGPKPTSFKPGSMRRNFSQGSSQVLYDANPDGYEYYVRLWHGYFAEYQAEFL